MRFNPTFELLCEQTITFHNVLYVICTCSTIKKQYMRGEIKLLTKSTVSIYVKN